MVAHKPLKVYTAGTPNGWPVVCTLEELKKHNKDLTWEVVPIDFAANEQKKDWFLKINPNGRIPALVDPNNDDFAVFESSAILLYLEKKYDPDHVLSWPSNEPKGDNLRSELLQWLFFAHGGIGPMQGQANVFRKRAVGDEKDVIPFAIKRYIDETKRLYTVLDARLQGRDYLVGEGKGKFTLADIKTAGWVVLHGAAGISRKELPPNVARWLDTIRGRDSFVAGLKSPTESDLVKNILSNPDWVAEMPQI
ncbi:unnamed protein product [Parajaminaea phylloscopi]